MWWNKNYTIELRWTQKGVDEFRYYSLDNSGGDIFSIDHDHCEYINAFEAWLLVSFLKSAAKTYYTDDRKFRIISRDELTIKDILE